MKLRVNEVFYSLQGEGARMGTPNIFIRLAGCNLACKFCDTEFNSYKEYTLDELANLIKKFACKNIIWTGGEPTLQLTEEVVHYFKLKGYYQAIETNGMFPIPPGINWITVSPKISAAKFDKLLNDKVPLQGYLPINEIKFVIKKGQGLPNTKTFAENYFISPMSDRDELNPENLKHCIELIKNQEGKKWMLTFQAHKVWKIK